MELVVHSLASFALNVLYNRVTDVICKEYVKFKNVEKALESLQTTISEGRALLREVDSLLQGYVCDVMQLKMDKLTGLCYDAEDLVDGITIKIAEHNLGAHKTSVFKAIVKAPTKWSVPHAVSELQKKLDGIIEQLKQLKALTKNPETTTEPNNEYCNNLNTPLVGRDGDIQAIFQELLSSTSKKGVSIIGMDGVGKTALAQTILNDSEIVKRFHFRLWVHARDKSFNFKETIDELVRRGFLRDEVNATPQASESSRNNVVLQQQVQSLFIVFDNLLGLKDIEWGNFCSRIGSNEIYDSKNRSTDIKILITTFNPRVSELTGTSAYYLKPLSKDSCKAIIIEKMLENKNSLSKMSLSVIADILAQKCEGLPLVAEMLGRILARCSEDERDTILRKDLWDLPEFKEQYFPILMSSYRNMPPELKRCLAYFSLFPCDYRFNIDDLIYLWMGEGFIHQPKRNHSLDHTAADYFKDLVKRSILQLSDDVTHNRKPRYELHKFSHKFAQSIASRTFLRLDEGASLSVPLDIYPRHLSLSCQDINLTILDEVMKLKGLRTFMPLSVSKIGRITPCLFKKLKRLRVLALNKTNVEELPDSIEKLKHLRYLDISNTPIRKLPETLAKLHTLQFLKLMDTKNLHHLPEDFQNLTNLLWLDWEISDIERLAPSYIGKLSSLQSLPLFSVGNKEGYFITELRNLNDLRGSICITNLDSVKDGEQAMEAELYNKYLKRIELQWKESRQNDMAKDVLTSLKPGDHLKELRIEKYGSVVFPQWLTHPFPLLEKIHLQECGYCNILPAFEKLPSLKFLVLEEMSSLEVVYCGLSSSGSDGRFPSLEKLVLKRLSKLHEWTELEANDMPRLRVLDIIDCEKLINLPSLIHLTSLVELKIEYCPALKSLPELPTSLKSLIIRESELLEVRCQVGGLDWSKVDSIVKVEIDYLEISTSGVSLDQQHQNLGVSLDQQHQNLIPEDYKRINDSAGALLNRLVDNILGMARRGQN